MNRRILSIVIVVIIIAIAYKFLSNVKQESNHMITAKQVQEKLNKNENFTLLDVRTKEEYEQGRIPGSVLLPLDELEKKSDQLLADKNEEIIIYCRSGARSDTARKLLVDKGYKKVYDLGGIIDWPYEIEK
ncbi:rhodanese-like domain-containing protein [Serpentinicella alkaliphila]|uniref:Rhodanese-related sulfurtransferase n=1 Tax=Serpentinicella alkaliphila TaxID=1734049 RepID=A0A4R2TPU2_9FIRM|nr:rhodanese-like domain-containing protein [Serpentinicella alkaliphila]QUH24566.1 rhodanese-like domain-containing protein [Serpentinicella alkaliphila]TCQ04662.1 rhodanese-related sulfurtransferase [Serpentinicella alkaliphila]